MAEHYQLKCRECGKLWGNQARSFCDECLSPLEVIYDMEAIARRYLHARISRLGPSNLWRYSALLPLPEDYEGTLPTGFTPLVHARRLGKKLGASNLYLKNDAVCFPTLSFKDRVVAMLWPRRADLVSRWLAARPPAIWRTPWPRRRRAKVSMRGFLFPPTSNPQKSPARRSSARSWCASRATTIR